MISSASVSSGLALYEPPINQESLLVSCYAGHVSKKLLRCSRLFSGVELREVCRSAAGFEFEVRYNPREPGNLRSSDLAALSFCSRKLRLTKAGLVPLHPPYYQKLRPATIVRE